MQLEIKRRTKKIDKEEIQTHRYIQEIHELFENLGCFYWIYDEERGEMEFEMKIVGLQRSFYLGLPITSKHIIIFSEFILILMVFSISKTNFSNG